MKLVNIGFGNMVNDARLVAVVGPDAAPVKRMVAEAREGGRLIDATNGRRTKAVLFTDSGHIVLSAALPETLAARVNESEEPARGEEEKPDAK